MGEKKNADEDEDSNQSNAEPYEHLIFNVEDIEEDIIGGDMFDSSDDSDVIEY